MFYFFEAVEIAWGICKGIVKYTSLQLSWRVHVDDGFLKKKSKYLEW